MRRLFLFLFVCLAFGACRKQVDGFRVMGTVNKESGKVLLKRMYGGLLGDTLAIAEIKNGKFELTGKVKNLEAAFLDFGIQKKMRMTSIIKMACCFLWIALRCTT